MSVTLLYLQYGYFSQLQHPGQLHILSLLFGQHSTGDCIPVKEYGKFIRIDAG